MKAFGIVFLVSGIALLLCGIICLFAMTSPTLIGGSILLSIVLNAVGITLLTAKNKK